MTKDLEHIKNKILPILIEAEVKRAAIFGSYARGEESKESDIDILVDLPEDKSLFDLADLKLKLEDKLKFGVDVLTFDSVNPLLKDYIERDQIKIL